MGKKSIHPFNQSNPIQSNLIQSNPIHPSIHPAIHPANHPSFSDWPFIINDRIFFKWKNSLLYLPTFLTHEMNRVLNACMHGSSLSLSLLPLPTPKLQKTPNQLFFSSLATTWSFVVSCGWHPTNYGLQQDTSKIALKNPLYQCINTTKRRVSFFLRVCQKNPRHHLKTKKEKLPKPHYHHHHHHHHWLIEFPLFSLRFFLLVCNGMWLLVLLSSLLFSSPLLSSPLLFSSSLLSSPLLSP